MLTKKINIQSVFFILILSLIILYRYKVLVNFGFEYTDGDQSVMWQGVMDYAAGKFHEPRFYGQAYNSMLESLFAVPLYKLGIPVYKALPIITSFLALFPYLLIALLTFRKKSAFVGLIILSIPLLLPNEYELITCLSRGFVTGIFVASFGVISLFYEKKWSFFLLGVTSVLGYSINANSVIISFPCLFYLFLLNKKNITFYIYCGIGLLLGAAIHLWINSFYVLHPFYNLHRFTLKYSFDLMINSFDYLDNFFNDVIPLFWNQGFIFLLFYLLIGIILIVKQNFQLGIFLLSIPILIILTLGISKVHDGTDSVFFSLSRMYLGLPILIGISLIFIKKLKFNYLYFIIPFSFLIYKNITLENSIIENTSRNKNHLIGISKVSSVLKECTSLSNLCKQNNVDLVIVINDYNYAFINYGCTTCEKEFPKTLLPIYERRTWRLIEDEKIIYHTILLLDNVNKLDEQFNFVEKVKDKQDKYLIKNNQFRTIELLNKMGIETRTFK